MFNDAVNNSQTLKAAIIGNSNVGKTCIIEMIMRGKYNPNTIPTTIKIEYIYINRPSTKELIRVKLCDTAGEEKYKSLIPSFVRGSDVILLTYDITKRSSFTELSSWKNSVGETAESDVTWIVVGNKTDLRNSAGDSDIVGDEEGKEYAQSINAEFVEVSAKEGTNIEELKSLIASSPILNKCVGVDLTKTNDKKKCC